MLFQFSYHFDENLIFIEFIPSISYFIKFPKSLYIISEFNVQINAYRVNNVLMYDIFFSFHHFFIDQNLNSFGFYPGLKLYVRENFGKLHLLCECYIFWRFGCKNIDLDNMSLRHILK